jgi:sugar phosphate isomerase/epimerase
MLEKAERFGTTRLELEYRISSLEFDEIAALSRSSPCTVTALHNICPRPHFIPPDRADADYYRLCSTDENERQLAVDFAVRTVRRAHEIGAPFAVLHLGDTGQDKMKARFHELINLRGGLGDRDRLFCDEYRRERAARAPECFDRALRSLDTIAGEAVRRSVTIGIENRYYVHQVPDFGEMGGIIARFDGAPVGVWLDFGHAFAQGLLGNPGLDDYIETYGEHITGCHIHDCLGSIDHRPPGTGEIDFRRYLPLIRSVPAATLEIRPVHDDEEFMAGVEFIAGLAGS